MTHALKKGLLSVGAPAPLVNDGIWIKGGFLLGVRRGFDIAVPVVTLRGIAFMVFAVPFALYFAYRLLINPDMSFLYVYGKKPDLEISRILKEDLSISYSPYFRGRLANLAVIDTPERFMKDPNDPTGKTILHDVFNAQLDADQEVANRYGGDFRRTAVQERVPILFDVNRFTGSGAAVTLAYFLNEKNDFRQVNLYTTAKFNRRIMEFMGVRFVITSSPLTEGPGIVLRSKEVIGDRLTLYLYELPNANVGNYSPTEQVVVKTAKEALDLIGDPAFDFRKSVIVTEKIPGDLSPAFSSIIKIEGNQLDIDFAETKNISLLVLPFEFSHCLSITKRFGAAWQVPKLFRVNLHQIGVLFGPSTSSTIKFRFNPFNTECRRQDMEDDKKLKFSELKTYKGASIRGDYPP